MITPVDKDRAIIHRGAVQGSGQGGSWWYLGDARAQPTVIALNPVRAKACRIGADAVAIPISTLAKLDMVNPYAPDEVKGIAGNVDVSLFVCLHRDEGKRAVRQTDRRRNL